MLKDLLKYSQKIKNNSESQEKLRMSIRVDYLQKIEKELDVRLKEHQDGFRVQKKNLHEEHKAVEYFIKLAEQSRDSQKEADTEQYVKNLDKVNLYSLFKTIDDKIVFNQALLTDFTFIFGLPGSAQVDNMACLGQKCKIMEENIKQLQNFVKKAPHYQRMTKQQEKQFQHITQKFKILYKTMETNKTNFQEKLKIKDTLGCVLSSLRCYNYLKEIDISIVSEKGVVHIAQYETLGELLFKNRMFTQNLKIKIMDMEFCQEKCDILKRWLKKMKYLEILIIQNYYIQCKLGVFQDFNWHPFRKKINIKGAVWK